MEKTMQKDLPDGSETERTRLSLSGVARYNFDLGLIRSYRYLAHPDLWFLFGGVCVDLFLAACLVLLSPVILVFRVFTLFELLDEIAVMSCSALGSLAYFVMPWARVNARMMRHQEAQAVIARTLEDSYKK